MGVCSNNNKLNMILNITSSMVGNKSMRILKTRYRRQQLTISLPTFCKRYKALQDKKY